MTTTSRRDFLLGGAALACAPRLRCAFASTSPHTENAGDSEALAASGALKVRFLGTGALDWEKGPNKHGETRRFASVLIDGRTLIDFTPRNREMLPEGCRPEAVFYTHSHRDHFDPEAALALGVKRVYCHESWAKTARRLFAAAAGERPAPEVNGVAFGAPVVEDGVAFTALPANHSTRKKGERCALYMLDKGAARLLYATDTCGIPRDALKYAGMERDAERPFTAIVMEATAGPGHADDARFFFSHSSSELVARTARALAASGRYRPAAARPVWITHMLRAQYGSMRELDSALPAPLKAAFDGMEIEFGNQSATSTTTTKETTT